MDSIMHKIKHRVFEIIQTAADDDKASKIFDIFIITLIMLNVVLVIADTFTLPYYIKYISRRLEVFSIIIFTIEYILRLWTSDMLYPQYGKFVSRVRYIFSFMALIDLFAILPFYAPLLIPIDLRALRILRMIRLLRIFKVSRYTNALSVVTSVLKNKSNQLISSVFVVALLMLISSVIMYNIENPAQPDVFINAFSGLWWAIATFTTVGYGDIYPITACGKVLSSVIALLGIGLVAVPTGIISAGFMEQIEQEKEEHTENKEKHFCPYCGERLD
ncbi:MAG: ion transporter [Clostridia bacterium]|nr:ion transporter [Clostridia bacterium]